MNNSELSLTTIDNDILYSQTEVKAPQPPVYSTLAEPPGEHTEDYSAISNTATYATAGACDDGLHNHTHHGHVAPPTVGGTHAASYSAITEAQDASNDGLVYSAVVRQDGIKTTVKTTAQIDEQQQQSVSDTNNDGLVYSAVVVKDGIKTTVNTTVFKD